MRNRKEFTLIVLMIIIAILGILAAIAIPNFIKYKKRVEAKQAKIEKVEEDPMKLRANTLYPPEVICIAGYKYIAYENTLKQIFEYDDLDEKMKPVSCRGGYK